MTEVIKLPADVYEVFKKTDPLYADRVRKGLEIGVIEIIDQPSKGEIPCPE